VPAEEAFWQGLCEPSMTSSSRESNGINNNGSLVHHDDKYSEVASRNSASFSIPLSNAALEAKAKQLQQQSAQLSAALTQKLATSQSGQNLLHMGTSLSSLPPDLHVLLQNLHPILSATEALEKTVAAPLEKVTSVQAVIGQQQARGRAALTAAETYQDLIAAERIVARDISWRSSASYRLPLSPAAATTTDAAANQNETTNDGGNDESDDGKSRTARWLTFFHCQNLLLLTQVSLLLHVQTI
jgi:hypothetical protein